MCVCFRPVVSVYHAGTGQKSVISLYHILVFNVYAKGNSVLFSSRRLLRENYKNGAKSGGKFDRYFDWWRLTDGQDYHYTGLGRTAKHDKNTSLLVHTQARTQTTSVMPKIKEVLKHLKPQIMNSLSTF